MKIIITDDDDYDTQYTINDNHLIEYIRCESFFRMS